MRKTAAVIFTLLVAVAPAMADDDCRASIDQATALFDRYHEDAANFDRAVTRYEEAANSDACAYEARWRLSELYLCWGTVARDKKEKIAKFEAGVRYAEQAIEKNAGGKEAHYELAANLGSIVQIKGPMKHLMKVRRLRKENQKALAIDPKFAPALVVEAGFNAEMPGLFGGSDEAAEKLYKQAMDSDPGFGSAYVEYAQFLFKRKRFDEAQDVLEKLLSPGFRRPYTAPWVTIEKPRAETLLAKINMAR